MDRGEHNRLAEHNAQGSGSTPAVAYPTSQHTIKVKGKAHTAQAHLSFGKPKEGASSPERRAYNAIVDPYLIKLRKSRKRFQTLAEQNGQEPSIENDRIK
jgi:hypothetical protein